MIFNLLTFAQIDSVVHFETRKMLDNWDKQIQSLCFQVSSCILLVILIITT